MLQMFFVLFGTAGVFGARQTKSTNGLINLSGRNKVDKASACWETTVGDQRAHNIHARDGITADEFVFTRETRDRTLGMPRLIIPSLQVNMKAGALPAADANGNRFLKVPLNVL